MAIFKKSKTAEEKEIKSASKRSEKSSDAQKKESTVSDDAKIARYAHILLKPHVSEKAAVLAEQSVYVFDVALNANKVEIAKAVRAIYGVEVVSVRTQRGIGKVVSRGKIAGRRSSWKKALVELKKGQKLTLVEGV